MVNWSLQDYEQEYVPPARRLKLKYPAVRNMTVREIACDRCRCPKNPLVLRQTNVELHGKLRRVKLCSGCRRDLAAGKAY